MTRGSSPLSKKRFGQLDSPSAKKREAKGGFGAVRLTVVRSHVSRTRSYGGGIASANPLHDQLVSIPGQEIQVNLNYIQS